MTSKWPWSLQSLQNANNNLYEAQTHRKSSGPPGHNMTPSDYSKLNFRKNSLFSAPTTPRSFKLQEIIHTVPYERHYKNYRLNMGVLASSKSTKISTKNSFTNSPDSQNFQNYTQLQ
jgi:hypothetical protein